MTSERNKKVEYETKKAIEIEVEGVKFYVILPEIETATKAQGSVRDLSAGGEREVKKNVKLFLYQTHAY